MFKHNKSYNCWGSILWSIFFWREAYHNLCNITFIWILSLASFLSYTNRNVRNSITVKVICEFCCSIRLSVKTKYMLESVLALVSILLFDGKPDGCQFRPTTFSICRSRNFIEWLFSGILSILKSRGTCSMCSNSKL